MADPSEERRRQLLAQVNAVEARRRAARVKPRKAAEPPAERPDFFYEQVAAIIKANPGCKITLLYTHFPSQSRLSVQWALQKAKKHGLIDVVSMGRNAKWYPR